MFYRFFRVSVLKIDVSDDDALAFSYHAYTYHYLVMLHREALW